MILDRILREIPPGTVIPKPQARAPFRVEGEGTRRGEPAIIYIVPNHRNPAKPIKKGITASEFEQACAELRKSRQLTRDWFNSHLPQCANEGACNFTTLGGLLQLLGQAEYGGRGWYRRLHYAPLVEH